MHRIYITLLLLLLLITYRLNIIMAINENGLLGRIVTNTSENNRRQVQFSTVPVLLTKVASFDFSTKSLEFINQELGHLEDIRTVRGVTTDTINRDAYVLSNFILFFLAIVITNLPRDSDSLAKSFNEIVLVFINVL